jgi:hypothetical protein
VLKIEQTNPTPKYTRHSRRRWMSGTSGAPHCGARAHDRGGDRGDQARDRRREASLTQPVSRRSIRRRFEGETIKKDVTVKADFKSPDGKSSRRRW